MGEVAGQIRDQASRRKLSGGYGEKQRRICAAETWKYQGPCGRENWALSRRGIKIGWQRCGSGFLHPELWSVMAVQCEGLLHCCRYGKGGMESCFLLPWFSVCGGGRLPGYSGGREFWGVCGPAYEWEVLGFWDGQWDPESN